MKKLDKLYSNALKAAAKIRNTSSRGHRAAEAEECVACGRVEIGMADAVGLSGQRVPVCPPGAGCRRKGD